MSFISKEKAGSPLMAIVYFVSIFVISFIVPAVIPGEAGGVTSMLLILAMILLVGYLKGVGTREIGLVKPKSWIKAIGLGLFYAIVVFIVFRISLEPLLESVTGTERDLSRFDYLKGNLSELLNTIVILWITAAFFEEVLYRGFLTSNVASMLKYSKLGWGLGIGLSALIFAVAHGYQGLSGILLTGSAALFFTWIFFRHGKNLWIPIIAHGITDTSGALLVYFDVYEEVTSVFF